jgi:hypothetical protein
MDHVDWIPEWPAPPPDDIRYEAFSSIYSPLSPAMPQSEMSVALDSLEARGAITLVQSPTAANGYTTVLEFNDDWWGSHATYRARLTYSVVPEPPRPPLITGQPARVVFREGVQGCITVRVGGFPTPEAQWFFAGAAVPGGTDATLTLPAVTRALEGIYWLVASNASGQATSAPILAVVSNVDPERFVAFQWAGRTEGGLTLESADRLGAAAAWQTLSNYPPAAAEQRWVEFEPAAAGAAQFYRLSGSGSPPLFTGAGWVNGLRFDAVAGSRHQIEYVAEATGWTNWQALTNLVLPASPYLFLDYDSLNVPVRVYRTTPAP